MRLLTRISHNVNCLVTARLPNTQHENTIDKVNEVIDVYEAGGFPLKKHVEIKKSKNVKDVTCVKRKIKIIIVTQKSFLLR